MRCGCPECGTLMIHEESGARLDCCCPVCGTRCSACLGTDSVLSRADIEAFRAGKDVARIEKLEQTVLESAVTDDGQDEADGLPEDRERFDGWTW